MQPVEYWISELAALSGVSNRTIRYYIQEGLLPPPEIRGKYAVFTEEYLHRLELIKTLKDAYLPLNRIKLVLDALDDAQIVPLLKEFEQDPVSALASLQALPIFDQEPLATQSFSLMREDSALDYIHKVRGGAPAQKPPAVRRTPSNIPPLQTSPVTAEEWQRIVLAPGVELHLRTPADPDARKLLKEIIELSRSHQLFRRKNDENK